MVLFLLPESADVLVAAVGVPGLVKPSWIKRGALVLDAGVHVVKGKIIGDVSGNPVKTTCVFRQAGTTLSGNWSTNDSDAVKASYESAGASLGFTLQF